MLYPDKDMPLAGYTDLWVTYGSMFTNGSGTPWEQDYVINDDWVRNVYIPTVPIGTKRVCFDVEHYAKTGPLLQDTIDKLTHIVDLWREERPEMLYGYYSLMIRDYWRAIGTPQQQAEWHAENDALAPIIDHMDENYPSVYTFYADQAGNDLYIQRNLQEQRRVSPKPVYPFIWPQFHNSNATLGEQQIPGGYWQKILDRVYAEDTQGMVAWGWRFLPPDQTWAAKADWWPMQEAFRGSKS